MSKKKPPTSAAQTAVNPSFLVKRVNVLALPPSFRKDGGRKRFSPTLDVPPPGAVKVRVPVKPKRKRWWQ